MIIKNKKIGEIMKWYCTTVSYRDFDNEGMGWGFACLGVFSSIADADEAAKNFAKNDLHWQINRWDNITDLSLDKIDPVYQMEWIENTKHFGVFAWICELDKERYKY